MENFRPQLSPPQRLPLGIPIKKAIIEKIDSARGTMGWRASLWYQLQALGTGNYLSPGGWGEGFEGGSLDFQENKRGDQLKLRTQKGRSLKLWKDSRGTTQICLENEDMEGGGGGGGRSPKSSKVIRGDHFGKVTLKGGIG